MVLSLSNKIFVTWYCRKLQKPFIFSKSSNICFLSRLPSKHGGNTTGWRRHYEEKYTFPLSNFNPFLVDGLTGKNKSMTMPLSFPIIKLPFGKYFIYIFYMMVEVCSAVLFGWIDSMYKVTENRSSTNTQNYWVRTKELFDI